MEFKGSKDNWILSMDKDYILINDYAMAFKGGGEEWKANALLISKALIHLEELKKEVVFLKEISKTLDDLDSSRYSDVDDRIIELEELIKKATEL